MNEYFQAACGGGRERRGKGNDSQESQNYLPLTGRSQQSARLHAFS